MASRNIMSGLHGVYSLGNTVGVFLVAGFLGAGLTFVAGSLLLTSCIVSVLIVLYCALIGSNYMLTDLSVVEQARALMQQKASVAPIGFNLLPKLFTLSQLQSLYEAIYGEAIDKRNFRKRIAEMDYIEKTDLIDKTSSKRGAALYQFNEKVYRKAPKFKL